MNSYQKHHAKAEKIIKKHIAIARQNGVTENFGEKEYRKFREQVNFDESLSYAEKAMLCDFLSNSLNAIEI